jgi:hypothetical protein
MFIDPMLRYAAICYLPIDDYCNVLRRGKAGFACTVPDSLWNGLFAAFATKLGRGLLLRGYSIAMPDILYHRQTRLPRSFTSNGSLAAADMDATCSFCSTPECFTSTFSHAGERAQYPSTYARLRYHRAPIMVDCRVIRPQKFQPFPLPDSYS